MISVILRLNYEDSSIKSSIPTALDTIPRIGEEVILFPEEKSFTT